MSLKISQDERERPLQKRKKERIGRRGLKKAQERIRKENFWNKFFQRFCLANSEKGR